MNYSAHGWICQQGDSGVRASWDPGHKGALDRGTQTADRGPQSGSPRRFWRTATVFCVSQQSVSVIKSGNVKRNLETKHAEYYIVNYPPKSELHSHKIDARKSSLVASSSLMMKATTTQSNVTEASLSIVWVLGRHKKAFTDAEVVKECMMSASSVLFSDKKCVELIQQIPLSDSTASRRADDLSDNVGGQLISDLKQAELFALVCDESTDKTDMSQLCVFTRFFDGHNFVDEFLTLLPLAKQTRGEDVFSALSQFMHAAGLDVTKMVSLTTDGAPAMTSKDRGLVTRMKALQTNLVAYHCIIHQSALCSKLCDELAEVMSTLVKLVNFLRCNSTLQHRLFRSFLEEMSAEFGDLLLHNDVRWLSKGRVLERFWNLREDVADFLQSLNTKKAAEFLTFIQDKVALLAFLVDIMGHINTLNLSLQGADKTVVELQEKCCAFETKLSVFINDLEGGKMLHFPNLKSCMTADPPACFQLISTFLHHLKVEFDERFKDFRKLKPVFLFVAEPFIVQPDSEWTSVAASIFPNSNPSLLKMEAADLQASHVLKAKLNEVDITIFWSKFVPDSHLSCCKETGDFRAHYVWFNIFL
ncbi:general transcription factor II-I repeat domain-containing protein 2-like [Polypterus senegalus]|uniref:general transcription factor II-I repeat domain-containing protein 2-like n=1 Tax=Polypterus senegalus TaxID=55291 RepID=UPI00196241BE|nr:general transcription factor II-I repeat domain-containing protein 2-like [Polypterus senegalus]